MTFLSPWAAILAGAVALPVLLLLYFLKLRREPMRIASTLLWERAAADLEANTPFQRLRLTLLLLIQLLLLALLLFAMARPAVQAGSAEGGRTILVIDISASMRAQVEDAIGDEPPRTRLDVALDAARDYVRTIEPGGDGPQVMIIAFGAAGQVVTGFESNRQVLLDALDRITPTDETGNLEAALQLTSAFASRREDTSDPLPEVILISDGSVAPPTRGRGYVARAGAMRYVNVLANASDAPTANVGIASFGARREFEDPAQVLVFARLVNSGTEAVETSVTLFADGERQTAQRLTVPGAADRGPGEASVRLSMESSGGAVLRVEHSHVDALPTDDTAVLVLAPPQDLQVAIVYPDGSSGPDVFVGDLVEAMEPQNVREITASAFAGLADAVVDGGEMFDLVVFDRVSGRLPGVPSLTFGATPRGVTTIDTERAGGRRILSWDRRHPVTRNISLDALVFDGFGAFDLPAGATPLASSADGPVIAAFRTRGARHLAVGFELRRSSWPTDLSIALFLQNAIDFLTLPSTSGAEGAVWAPGAPITVRATGAATEIVVDGPVPGRVPATPGATVTLPLLRLTGLYDVQGATPPMDRVAVSLLSDVESDLRRVDQLQVNAEALGSGGIGAAAPRELWPWFVAAAFALLLVEWTFYLGRAGGA